MVTIDIWRARIGSYIKSFGLNLNTRQQNESLLMRMMKIAALHFIIFSILLVIGNVEVNPGPHSFQCHSCGKELASLGAHAHHQRIHAATLNFSFICGSCKLGYNLFKSLQSHISKCHKEDRNKCPEENSEILDKHRCTICNEQFQSLFEFLKHTRDSHIESEENGVVCPLVDECLSETPFKQKALFNIHISKCHDGWKSISKQDTNFPSREFSTHTTTQDVEDNTQQVVEDDDQMFFEDHEQDDDNDSYLDAEDTFSLTEDDIFNFICSFYTMLEADFLVSIANIDKVSEQLTLLSEILHDHMKVMMQTALQSLNIPQDQIDNVLVKMLNCNVLYLSHHKHVRGPTFTTDPLRKKFFFSTFDYLEPEEKPINPRDPTEDETFQYVSVRGVLTNLLKDPSIQKEVQASFEKNEAACQVTSPTIFKDYTDGQVWRDRNLPAKRLDLIIFQDAFSATSMLTTVRQKHKTLGVYMTLGNLPSKLRTKLKAINLLMLILEKFVKKYRQKCFKPLVKELKDLEVNGIEFMGETVPVFLQFIVGDNLGSHFIGGFLEGFTAKFFCRYCDILRANFLATPNLLGTTRTHDSYRRCFHRKDLRGLKSFRGVKEYSIFNELTHFKVCDPGLPPCLGHDLFHGVMDWDFAEIISYFVKQKWFSYETLNRRINHFKYSMFDSKNKPAPVKMSGEKLGGSAVQNWTLFRLFPFIIEGCIKDTSDPYWRLYLKLKKILELVCAPAITSNQIDEMDDLINSYLTDRVALLSTPSRPKGHFLRHYGNLTRALGPLIKLWAMRFEQKHQFFKKVAKMCNNFIHLMSTMAKKHQLLMAHQSKGARFEESVKCSPVQFSPNYFGTDVSAFIKAQNLSSSLKAAHNIEVDGMKYHRGCWFVVKKNSAPSLIIAQIEGVIFNGPSPLILLREQKAVNNDLLGLYEILEEPGNYSPIFFSCCSISIQLIFPFFFPRSIETFHPKCY